MEGERLQNKKLWRNVKGSQRDLWAGFLSLTTAAGIRAHETPLFAPRTETDFRPPEKCPPTSCCRLSRKEPGSQHFPLPPPPPPFVLSVCPTESHVGHPPCHLAPWLQSGGCFPKARALAATRACLAACRGTSQ